MESLNSCHIGKIQRRLEYLFEEKVAKNGHMFLKFRLNTHVKPLIWIESVIEKHAHSR